jgi:RNA polymerase sigma-54 factor
MNQVYLGQYLKLEQKLTPQQILLSTLLQLPLLSLEQRIKSELEQNPVLEEGEEDDAENQEEVIDADSDEMEELEEELKLHEKNGSDSE